MSECLVTKLRASVTDNSLLRLGEMRFKLQADTPVFSPDIAVSTQQVMVRFLEDTTLEIIGDGHFCSDDGQTIIGRDNGKHLDCVANEYTTFSISPNTTVAILNKYALDSIRLPYVGKTIFNIDDLEYCTSLLSFDCRSAFGVYGNLNRAFKNTVDLTEVIIRNASAITGDISVFADKTSMTKIDFYLSYNIGGDIGLLSALVNLTTLMIYDGGYGELSQLSPVIIAVNTDNGAWGRSRPSQYSIPSLDGEKNGGIELGDTLDDALVNLANCTAQSGGYISLKGTATANTATYAAALKAHCPNYTIKVNGITY